MMICCISGLLLAVSGHYSPYPAYIDSCATQLLIPSRLVVMFVGSIALALTAMYLGYDSFKMLALLGILILVLFWGDTNENDFGDLRNAARLNGDECVLRGMVLIIGFCGSTILALKLGRAVIRRWQRIT